MTAAVLSWVMTNAGETETKWPDLTGCSAAGVTCCCTIFSIKFWPAQVVLDVASVRVLWPIAVPAPSPRRHIEAES